MKIINYVLGLIGILLLALMLNNIYMHYKEENKLDKYIVKMNISRNDFSSESQFFSKISDYIDNDFNTEVESWKHSDLIGRSFLRNSVTELLEFKEGVCGEGTRLMIRILQTLGYDATRLAFYDKRFGAAHALVSVELNGVETIVDTINFNKELHEILRNNNITTKSIDIVYYDERFQEVKRDKVSPFSKFFKEHYSTYSYESVPYVKLVSKLGLNKHIFNFTRPNKYVSYLAESVYLIKAVFYFFLLLLLISFLKIINRNNKKI